MKSLVISTTMSLGDRIRMFQVHKQALAKNTAPGVLKFNALVDDIAVAHKNREGKILCDLCTELFALSTNEDFACAVNNERIMSAITSGSFDLVTKANVMYAQ